MEYIGIDLHQKNLQICVLNDQDDEMEEITLSCNERAIKSFYKSRTNCISICEASSLSPWLKRFVESLGHEIHVYDPRKNALIGKSNSKTDKRDAHVLAQLYRADPTLLSYVYHRKIENQKIRMILGQRKNLVACRTKLINNLRGSMKSFGIKLPRSITTKFTEKVIAKFEDTEYFESLKPMLSVIDEISKQINTISIKINDIAEKDETIKLLQTVPGVGPIIALSFKMLVEDPYRFKNSRALSAYIGLVPRVRSSGGITHIGRITKAGESELRRLLVQGAHVLLNASKHDSDLKQWAEQLRLRIGKHKAVVAVARKLSIIMHTMWINNQEFQSFRTNNKAA